MRRIERGAVYDGWERIVGYKCSECGGVFESMWGNVCKGCRKIQQRHEELIEALNKNKQPGG